MLDGLLSDLSDLEGDPAMQEFEDCPAVFDNREKQLFLAGEGSGAECEQTGGVYEGSGASVGHDRGAVSSSQCEGHR